jgi:hypothetical protein
MSPPVFSGRLKQDVHVRLSGSGRHLTDCGVKIGWDLHPQRPAIFRLNDRNV